MVAASGTAKPSQGGAVAIASVSRSVDSVDRIVDSHANSYCRVARSATAIASPARLKADHTAFEARPSPQRAAGLEDSRANRRRSTAAIAWAGGTPDGAASRVARSAPKRANAEAIAAVARPSEGPPPRTATAAISQAKSRTVWMPR